MIPSSTKPLGFLELCLLLLLNNHSQELSVTRTLAPIQQTSVHITRTILSQSPMKMARRENVRQQRTHTRAKWTATLGAKIVSHLQLSKTLLTPELWITQTRKRISKLLCGGLLKRSLAVIVAPRPILTDPLRLHPTKPLRSMMRIISPILLVD